MAKKKKTDGNIAASLAEIEKSNWSGCHGLMDDLLKQCIAQGQEKQLLDGQIFSANDILARLIFLPMPALAPRFLVQNDGWPLGRFVMISGLQEACKSAFTFEVGTWHRRYGGNHVCVECEQKDAARFRDSFFNYDRSAWAHTRCSSQDHWNRAFFYWMEQFHNMMDGYDAEVEDPETGKKKKVRVNGRGRAVPFSLAVDSISAVTLEKFVDQILEEGAPDQQYAVGAKMLAEFFRVGPKQMMDYPISFLAVSHQKMSTDKRNPNIQIRNTTGGASPKFQMTFEIEMKRRKAGQYTRVHKKYGEINSIDLFMQIRKNSLGDHEGIGVEMCWYRDPDDWDPVYKELRQKTYFDWHSASIELLRDSMTPGDSGKGFSTRRSKSLRELIDLSVDDNRRTCTSKTLGVEKLSFFEAGQILEHKIQTDSKFQDALYGVMGIRKQFQFQKGVDFRDQIAANLKRLREAEENTAKNLTDGNLVLPDIINGDVPVPTDPPPFDEA